MTPARARLGLAVALVALVVSMSCGRSLVHPASAKKTDAGVVDAGVPFDAGQEPVDAGPPDAGRPWWFQLHSDSPVEVGVIAVDAHDHVLVAGQAAADVTLGSTPTGVGTLFLAKFAADGTPMWARRFGSASSASAVTGLATDANDRIYLTGHFSGSGFSYGPLVLVNRGSTDLFTAAVSTDGMPLWLTPQGSAGADVGGPLALDQLGRVITTGRLSGHLGVTIFSSAGAVVAHAESPGDIYRHDPLASPARAIGFDAAGRILVGGTFLPGPNLGAGPTPSSAYEAAFLSVYSRLDAVFESTRVFTTSMGNVTTFQGVEANGVFASGSDLSLVGRFAGTVDFGSGPIKARTTSTLTSGFVATMAPFTLASVAAYSPGNDTPILGLSHDRAGRPVLTADWHGAAIFKGVSITSQGPSTVTLDAQGTPVDHRGLTEVRDRSDLAMTPVVHDSFGSPVFVLEALHKDSLTLTTFPAVGPSDALVVHLVR